MIRVVLDNNVPISVALAQRGPLLELREAWEGGRFALLASSPLLNEVRRVLERPKIADRLSRERLTEPVVCREPYPEFSDPADDFLLAMLRDGDADCLVTGGGAFLELGRLEGKEILTAAAFVELLEADS